MNLYREENIRAILRALDLDEYDDAAQDAAVQQDDFLPELAEFLNAFVKRGKVLEVGCGSGLSLGRFGITHGVEPNGKRFAKAKARFDAVAQAVAECIEFPAGVFDTVVMINGFFQVRSDYEALIEVNRVLRPGGVFILNLLTNDAIDLVCGRCLGFRNYIRLMEQFGFELQAYKEMNAGKRFVPATQVSVAICMVKVRPFDPKWLCLPQCTTTLLNYVAERDWRLL